MSDGELLELGPSDLPEIERLARTANDVPYPLERVIAEKCFAPGVGGMPFIFGVRDERELAGFAVVCGKFLRLLVVAREKRRCGIGSQLLQAAIDQIGRGHPKILVGGEPGNYFVPGVLSSDEATRHFFEQRAFTTTAEAIQLTADLRKHDWRAERRSIPLQIERATQEVADELLAWIEREFGSLWRFEVSRAFDQESIPLFIARRDGTIAGFSAHEVNNRGMSWYGPAGVGAANRGSGIGRELLLESLADLRARGYDRVIIPWVSSIDFYRKVAGAEVEMTFVGMEKELKEW